MINAKFIRPITLGFACFGLCLVATSVARAQDCSQYTHSVVARGLCSGYQIGREAGAYQTQLFQSLTPTQQAAHVRLLSLHGAVFQIMRPYVAQARAQCVGTFSPTACESLIIGQPATPENVRRIMAAIGTQPEEYDFVYYLLNGWAMSPRVGPPLPQPSWQLRSR